MADLTETQKVAREASQLQNAERNADSMLATNKAMGEAAAMDRVEGTQAEMMPNEEPAASPRQALPQTTVGMGEPPFDMQKTMAPTTPSDAMSEGDKFLTRDRPELDLPDMSREELVQARSRLMEQMTSDGGMGAAGPQQEAYSVLLNRIESAIEDSAGPQ
jgi:hypothetical protein